MTFIRKTTANDFRFNSLVYTNRFAKLSLRFHSVCAGLNLGNKQSCLPFVGKLSKVGCCPPKWMSFLDALILFALTISFTCKE